MLDKLVFALELHAGNDPGWLDYPEMRKARIQAYEYADKVLRELEDEGMLPPDVFVCGQCSNIWEEE